MAGKGLAKIDRLRRDAMVEAILENGGVWNLAAISLGIAHNTFYRNAAKLGISRSSIDAEVREDVEDIVAEFRARRDAEIRELARANAAMRAMVADGGKAKGAAA